MALLVAALFFITGIALTFWGCLLLSTFTNGSIREDLWDTYRAAQWVGWGNEGSVYQNGIYSIVFPGIDVLIGTRSHDVDPLSTDRSVSVLHSLPEVLCCSSCRTFSR